MKRRDLERHLREHGCEPHHSGGEHDMWVNLTTLVQATMPRHRNVKFGTARSICRQLGVPRPKGK